MAASKSARLSSQERCFAAPAHRGHVVFFDERVRLAGQLDLGALRRPPQPGLQHAVPAGVAKPHPGLQVTVQALQDDRVEVVAAQVVVAAGSEHLDDPALDLHHRDVERAAAEVVDQDPALPFLAGVVGQGGGGRFVDDPHDLQAGDLSRLARGLPLSVREVRRHGDHRLADRPSQGGGRPLPERPSG